MATKYVRVIDEEVQAAFRQVMTSDEETAADLREATRKGIVRAKYRIRSFAHSVIGTGYKHSHGDPHEAYKAVRANIWKKEGTMGGSLTILRQTTGNATRGADGECDGESRGYILVFLNGGTRDRVTGGRNRVKKGVVRLVGNGKRIAYRGRIRGNNWFETSGMREAEQAAKELDEEYGKILIKRFNQ